MLPHFMLMKSLRYFFRGRLDKVKVEEIEVIGGLEENGGEGMKGVTTVGK